MPANIDPIYTLTPKNSPAATNPITLAMAAGNISAYNGTDANVVLLFTAGTNGSYLAKIRLKCGAITGTSAASVIRFWGNNGSTNATAANNYYIGEISLPAVTVSTTTSTPDIDYIVNLPLPAGHRIYCGLGTAVTTGWHVLAIGGDY